MVETEPDGKLHVSGHSSSRAAVRLYLNDSYRASTMAAADGHFAFTVAEGIGPGSHRARLDEVESGSGAVRSRAEVAFNVPAPLAANQLDEAVGSLHGQQRPQSDSQMAQQEDVSAAPDQQGPAAVPGKDNPSAVAAPKGATVVVSRGDSRWRISHAAYGTGLRYAVIFGANHHQIRNRTASIPVRSLSFLRRRAEIFKPSSAAGC
jgi:nucleoid-associated protein YgaU